jgi:tRNA pseudouridine55 synthase
MIIALGAATRAITVWQGGEKTYLATLRLGVITHTQDLMGDVLERRDVTTTEDALRAAATGFVGDLMQVPPMVSALKVGGQRLHALARRGIEVERAPRPIRVTEWTWLDVSVPEATFRVRCSSGTYVRTLAHDLGERLGCGAALKTLRRLRSEPFGLERAVTLRQLDVLGADEVIAQSGVALDAALEVLPGVTLDPESVERIGAGGRPSVVPGDAPLAGGPRSVVLRDGGGRALALGELTADPLHPGSAIACPHVVFPWAVRTGRP